MNETIRLGECWMVRLTKRDLCVRLESRTADGGWIARVMSHGRKITIKNATQLLQRCDKVRIYTVAEETTPNRRSHSTQPPENARKPITKANKTVVASVREPLAPMPLLDAAAVVLRESKTPLSTREIVALIVERKLWKPTGTTPWQTLNAALNRDIVTNGTQSRFKKKDRGKYALR
jgi:hypothetical protein